MTAPKPTAAITDGPDGFSVWAEYAGVDRPRTFGILVGPSLPLARRLAAAISAGAAMGPGRIATDRDGRTYVEADPRVMGRRLNADLRRLGF